MKAKGWLIIMVFLSLVLIFFSECKKRAGDIGWSANIEIVDGIKVITNPVESKYGEFDFELEEDLAIGDVNNEDYFFPRRVTLSVDNNGNIFVCDVGNRRVQKYDRDGMFMTTIGRQGQGPGEYNYPSRLFLDDDGNPCVSDSRAFLYYDKDGVFKEKVQLSGFYSRLIPGPHDTYIGSTQPNARAEKGAKTAIVQIGKDGKAIQTIAESSVSYNKGLKATVLHWYSNVAAFAQRTRDSFYYCFSRDYKINVADSNGSTIFIFRKEAEPQSITEEEKELTKKDGIYLVSGTREAEEAIVFPDHRPYFRNISSDDEGRLYVIRFKSILEREEKMNWVDVFSKEGIYLYQMNWSFIPALIKKDYMYEVRENEETGVIKLIRHKITNWGRFKEE